MPAHPGSHVGFQPLNQDLPSGPHFWRARRLAVQPPSPRPRQGSMTPFKANLRASSLPVGKGPGKESHEGYPPQGCPQLKDKKL